MIDGYGRTIDYLRISVTDRCDLRCVYCMPEEGVQPTDMSRLLRYEDILRLVKIFASLGFKKFRLTGGEPLVRRDLHILVRGIKQTPGVETVGITTNGTQLEAQLPQLLDAGLDLVNISLDSLDDEIFFRVSRRHGIDKVLRGVDCAIAAPNLKVKINCVPWEGNRSQILPILERFSKVEDIAVRFIELMPIGFGKDMKGIPEQELRAIVESRFGPLHPVAAQEHSGPARNFKADGFAGQIGFISAISHKFCDSCNRVRLTSEGFLKTCLQYEKGVSLRDLLSQSDEDIRRAIEQAIAQKPACHHFEQKEERDDEHRLMSQIGG